MESTPPSYDEATQGQRVPAEPAHADELPTYAQQGCGVFIDGNVSLSGIDFTFTPGQPMRMTPSAGQIPQVTVTRGSQFLSHAVASAPVPYAPQYTTTTSRDGDTTTERRTTSDAGDEAIERRTVHADGSVTTEKTTTAITGAKTPDKHYIDNAGNETREIRNIEASGATTVEIERTHADGARVKETRHTAASGAKDVLKTSRRADGSQVTETVHVASSGAGTKEVKTRSIDGKERVETTTWTVTGRVTKEVIENGAVVGSTDSRTAATPSASRPDGTNSINVSGASIFGNALFSAGGSININGTSFRSTIPGRGVRIERGGTTFRSGHPN